MSHVFQASLRSSLLSLGFWVLGFGFGRIPSTVGIMVPSCIKVRQVATERPESHLEGQGNLEEYICLCPLESLEVIY